MFLNSSVQGGQTFPPIQLLGLEMLLHYFLGPEVVATAATSKLQLTLGEGVGGTGAPLSGGRSCEILFVFSLFRTRMSCDQ